VLKSVGFPTISPMPWPCLRGGFRPRDTLPGYVLDPPKIHFYMFENILEIKIRERCCGSFVASVTKLCVAVCCGQSVCLCVDVCIIACIIDAIIQTSMVCDMRELSANRGFFLVVHGPRYILRKNIANIIATRLFYCLRPNIPAHSDLNS